MTEKRHVTAPRAVGYISRKRIFIPIVVLLLLVVFNLALDPPFLEITLGRNSGGDPVLTGYLMTILGYGSEVVILSIGMTLVMVASGGQDISVGAVAAITGSVIPRVLVDRGRDGALQVPILLTFLTVRMIAMLFGALNGVLVSIFNIQPMVATLILYAAGRSIVAWTNNNKLPIATNRSFTYLSESIPGIPTPTPFFLAVVCIVITMLMLKFTSLGLYTQVVGINSDPLRLNGLNPTFIKWLSFVILGLCVAVVALIKTSRLPTINYSVITKDTEMGAILAVTLGGNVLGDGKFNIMVSILRVYVIQFLTTTLCKFNVSSDAFPAYKAMVVILLVAVSTPAVKAKLSTLGRNLKK